MNTEIEHLTSLGRRFELEIFGETIPLTSEQAGRIPQLSFADSLDHAEKNAAHKLCDGTWNPRSPPTMIALELRQKVQDALRLPPTFMVELVKTLGTPIDIYWGVDGYFRLSGTGIIVTVDLTTNPTKIRSGQMKTDVLLTPSDLSSEEVIDAFARKVANLLRKRYKRFQHEAR